MRHRPQRDLPRQMTGIICAYNTDGGGYHETITQTSLRAARAEMLRHRADAPVHEILAALMATPLGHPDWLLEYWTKDLLMSPATRRDWRDPDIKPMPF